MSVRPLIRVNITSDLACPWCWVGKKCLEKAIAKRESVADFEVVWHPYFLNKGIPEGGVDKLETYQRKFGVEQAKKFLQDPNNMLRVRGRELGIDITWKEGAMIGNSMKGHRLLWHTYDKYGSGKQNHLMEILFRKYFAECENLGENAILVSAAAEAGLPTDVDKFLNSGAYTDEVESYHAKNQVSNINGVPHFTFHLLKPKEIDMRGNISGAQDPENFIQIFDRLLTQ